MKKVLVLYMIVALASFGCCTLTAPDGTVTKSFSNCLTTTQDKVCNASPDVLAVADTVLALVKPFIATALPGSAILMAYVTATNIKTYGCAGITELNLLIAFIQGYNIQAPVAAKAGMMKAPLATIDVSPLLNWRNGVK
jgi:hypothetical protein